MAARTGNNSLDEGRGPRDCVVGGVWLKVCSAAVVAVVQPH